MISNSLKRLAKKSTHSKFFHAAMIKKGGAVIAVGYNKNGEHAEAMAIRQARLGSLAGMTMTSVRVTKTGLLSNAKPCPACQAAAIKFGIKKISYSNTKRTLSVMKYREAGWQG